MALNRAEANEIYFEIPAALSFVIAPLLCTVKRITEVTYSKDIIDIVFEIAIDVGITIAIINVIAFAIVIHIALFEFFCKGEYFCNQVCNGGQLKPTQVFGKFC